MASPTSGPAVRPPVATAAPPPTSATPRSATPRSATPRSATPSAPWATALGSGLAVLLAGAPVSAVVQGTSWLGHATAVVAVVIAAGLLLHRLGAAVVVAGQSAAVLMLLTVQFTEDGILDLLPGPAALREFAALGAGASDQIGTGLAPVAPTPEILFLVTTAFGLLAVGVYLAAVGAGAPAAAGVPLLAVFAVPAALADDLLPWWAMASAAAGFGVLLVARGGAGRLAPGGIALVAGGIVLALGLGAGAGIVGTAGRFDGSGGSGGSIGLSPFTALRGQLDQTAAVELFRVRGLPSATYLRALTLRDYVPEAGFQATRPGPGTPLPGTIGVAPATPGELVEVEIENVAFRDYWLPLYGSPIDVSGLPEEFWGYDARSGTAYTSRPRQEASWRQRSVLSTPTAAQLRGAAGPASPGRDYLDVAGVDSRVGELAAQVVRASATPFDRALALQDHFTGPQSQFSYSLQTAPGAGDDALVEFLTVGKAGYCEQYASAMAVMLRTVGVPSRVAVGFTAGTEGPAYRTIDTSDAHAWVEAWFPDFGWTTFDPTPLTDGRAITPPYVQEAQAEGTDATQTPAEDELPAEQTPQQPVPEPTTPEQATPDAAAGGASNGGGLLWPVAVVVGLALLALVPALVRARRRRRWLAAVAAGGPDAAGAAWAELLAESTDRGAPSPPSDTVRSAARRLVREHRLDEPAQQALRQVVGAVEASWYGGDHPDAGALDQPVRTVSAAMVAGSPLRLRDRLLPPSVVRRARSDQVQVEDVAVGT